MEICLFVFCRSIVFYFRAVQQMNSCVFLVIVTITTMLHHYCHGCRRRRHHQNFYSTSNSLCCNVCHFYIYICRFIYSKICFVYNLCVCLCSFLAVTMLCLMARPIWDLFVKNKHIYIFIYNFCSSFEGDNILAKCF